MTMALILAVPRRLAEGERLMRGGGWTGWSPTSMLGHRIWGKRLGIVGMGRIGSAVARRARGFGLAGPLSQPPPRSPGLSSSELEATYWESLDQMLARMDIISVNCPHTPATYHLLSARRLKLLQPHADHRQHRPRRGDRRECADADAGKRRDRRRRPRRLRARAGGQPAAAAARQCRAAAAHGLGDDRRPHRHGREGHHQHQDLRRRPQARRTGCWRRCSKAFPPSLRLSPPFSISPAPLSLFPSPPEGGEARSRGEGGKEARGKCYSFAARVFSASPSKRK